MNQTFVKTRRQREGETRRTLRRFCRRDFSLSPCLPFSLSRFRWNWLTLAVFGLSMIATGTASAQPPNIRYGEAVPRDVREMY
jgi:hypothetical protein